MADNAKVLVVDDDRALAGFITELLNNFGYQVTTMYDSRQALEIYLESDGRYDLVITDQTMPGMTGVELATEIFKHNPEQAVILCTGYSDQIDAQRAEKLGIKSFLNKPMETRQLLAEVERLTNP
jgi:two-component system cell cycle sensor histidine kinase/response regulator CckA